MRDLWFVMDLQLFAADGGSGGYGGSNAGSGNGGDGTGDGGQGNAGGDGGKVTFTPEQQAHFDSVLGQRLARAQQTASAKAVEAQATELGFSSVEDMKAALKAHREAQDAARTETQRLQEQLDAEKAARASAEEGARTRLVNAEAKVQAVAAGVKAERVDYALRLADLSGVTIGEAGAVDSAAVKAAIDAVLKDVPELKGATGPVGSSSNPGGDGNSPKVDMNQFIRRSTGR